MRSLAVLGWAVVMVSSPAIAEAVQPREVGFVRQGRLSDSTHAGVTFLLREYASDRAYRIPPNTEGDVEIDYRSTAILGFRSVAPEGEPSLRWKRISFLLPQVRNLSQQRKDLNDLVNAPPAELHSAVRAFNEAVDMLLNELESLPALSDADVADILTGRFDGQPDPRRPYQNLMRWMTNEIAQGQDELDALRAAPLITVTVDATIQPLEGNRRGVAIEDWNDIGSGDVKQREHQGTDPTTAANATIDAAAAARADLQEIAANQDAPLQAHVKGDPDGAKVDHVDAALSQLPKTLVLPPVGRPLSKLTPARVDLAAAGGRPGDRVSFKVRFWDDSTGGVPRFQKDYRLRVRELGFYTRTAGVVTLVRRSAGTEAQQAWRMNVAAMVTGFHRIRIANESWERFVNWLAPGIGIHLASLDHTDQAVEFGLGVSASIWDGLLYAGLGTNLMLPANDPQDRGYFLIGTSLFEVLNRVQSSQDEQVTD